MEDSFEALEQRVRKAAEAVRRLRKQAGTLEEELARTRARLHEAEKRLADGGEAGGAAQAARLKAALEEVEALRGEREEVRARIARLVELLDGLEA